MKYKSRQFWVQITLFILGLITISFVLSQQIVQSTIYTFQTEHPEELHLQRYQRKFDQQIRQIIELSQQQKIIVVRSHDITETNLFLYELISQNNYPIQMQLMGHIKQKYWYSYINHFYLKTQQFLSQKFQEQQTLNQTLKQNNLTKIKVYDFRQSQKFNINQITQSCENFIKNPHNYNSLYQTKYKINKSAYKQNVKCIVIVNQNDFRYILGHQLKLHQQKLNQLRLIENYQKQSKNELNNYENTVNDLI